MAKVPGFEKHKAQRQSSSAVGGRGLSPLPSCDLAKRNQHLRPAVHVPMERGAQLRTAAHRAPNKARFLNLGSLGASAKRRIAARGPPLFEPWGDAFSAAVARANCSRCEGAPTCCGCAGACAAGLLSTAREGDEEDKEEDEEEEEERAGEETHS